MGSGPELRNDAGTPEEPDRVDPGAARPSGGPGFFVAFCLFATAVGILATGGSSEVVPPLGGTPPFDREQLSTASPRVALGHPPQLHLNGFDRTCQDCHALFESGDRATSARSDSERVQHVDIVLSHGKNDRCLVCHHESDRNFLSLLDGTTIRFDEADQLCRECHGLVGRDWEAGTHGRTHGSWRSDSPEQWRLTCTECHDPHAPAFPDYAPLPAPHTLRLPPPEDRHPHSPEPRWPRSAIDASRGPH